MVGIMRKTPLLFILAAAALAASLLFAFVIALPVGDGHFVSRPFGASAGTLTEKVSMSTLISVAASMKTMAWVLRIATFVCAALAIVFLILGIANIGRNRRATSTQACPQCAERVKIEAKVCRYCSSQLAPGVTS